MERSAYSVSGVAMNNRRVMIFIGFFGLLVVLAVVVPFIPGMDPNFFDPLNLGEPSAPSLHHWFGTDDLGRDVLLRCIYGARVSLLVGVIAVSISMVIGVILGLVSGYVRGRLDSVIMRSVDVMMAIPTIFLILILQVLFRPSLYQVMIVIGLTGWTGIARLVRAEVMSMRERVFVLALRSRGITHQRILFFHIVPNVLNPVIVSTVLGMGSAILTESVLSFLGLGVQPPHASWGNMLQQSLNFISDAPWLAMAPGICITCTVLALHFMGDAFRQRVNKE